MQKTVNNLLTSLGITSNYNGFYYITQALLLTSSGSENLLLVTKRLYPHIANIYHTSAKNVERNIRHAVDIAWNVNPQLLSELAGRTLEYRPTPGEFLAILANRINFINE